LRSEKGFGQGGDVDRSQAETGDDDPGDEAFFLRSEPFDGRRRRGRISQPDAGSGQNAEPDDQGPDHVGSPQTGDDQPEAAEDGSRRRDDLGPEAVLKAAGGDHNEGETGDGDRIGQRGRRLGPAEAAVGDRFRQLFAEHAPGVENAQSKIEAEPGHYDEPTLFRHMASL
jgi:hypothetical protein